MSGDKIQGWFPASYLRPFSEDEATTEDETTPTDGKTMYILSTNWLLSFGLVVLYHDSEEIGGGGEEYVAIAAYCGEHQEDLSFPEGARVSVVEKSSIGWWVIR